MKRLAVGLVVLSLAAMPATEAVAKKKKKKPAAHQHVEGSIAAPQPYPADGTCVYRGHRALASVVGEDANGGIGYIFDVDPKTVGLPFKLEVSDGAGMDISFYSEMGDPADPTVAPSNMPFETPGAGGEEGTVPDGFPIAFVCMTDGADATFTYMSGKGVK